MTNNSDQDGLQKTNVIPAWWLWILVHSFTSQSKVAWSFGRAMRETLSRLNSAYFERYKKCFLEISSGFDAPSRFFYILKYKKTNKQTKKLVSDAPKQIPL